MGAANETCARLCRCPAKEDDEDPASYWHHDELHYEVIEYGQVWGNILSTGFSTESPGVKLNTKPCSKCCRTIKHNHKLIGEERRQESDQIGKRSLCGSLESSRLVSQGSDRSGPWCLEL